MSWFKKLRFSSIWLMATFTIIGVFYFPFILDPSLWSKFLGISLLLLISLVRLFNTPFTFVILSKPLVFSFLFLFLILSFISSLLAINSAESISSLSRFLLYSVFFLVAFVLFVYNDYKVSLSRTASGLMLVSVVYAFVQLSEFKMFNDYHQNSYLIRSFYANRNLFVEVLMLCLGFSLYGSLYDSKYWKIFHSVSVAIILFGSVFLMVRSAWIAMFVFVLLALILLLQSGFRKYFTRKLLLRFFAAMLVFISVSLVLLVSNPGMKQTLLKQSYWLKNPDFGSSKERIVLWKTCLPMIQENPAFGVGPANWKLHYPRYYSGEIREVKDGVYTQFQRVHNDYLQIACEHGLPATICLSLFFIFILFYGFKTLRNTHENQDRIWIILMLSSLFVYFVFAFFSFPMERTEESILLTIILASILAEYVKTEKQPLPTKKFKTFKSAKLILIGICIFCVIVGYFRIKGEYFTYKLFEQRQVNNHEKVVEYSKKTKNNLYTLDPAGIPISFYEGAASFALGNLPSALRAYKESYALFPYQKQCLNDLASCYIVDKQIDNGIEFYKKTLKISPDFEDALVNLSIVYFQKEEIDSASFYILQCDTSSSQQNYRKIVDALNMEVLHQLYKKAENHSVLLQKKITDIAESRDWQWIIFKHAVESNQMLKKRFIIEILYSLLEIDKSISEAEEIQMEGLLSN